MLQRTRFSILLWGAALLFSMPLASFSADKADFWSFKPAEKPRVPTVRNREWPRNPMDLFVLAKLEENQMHPSPEADRRTLIRRVSFDVTGLPPAPEEVDAFVRSRDPQAYEKLVDRLLDADEVAAAVCWLCRPESSAVTGTVVHADGGFIG